MHEPLIKKIFLALLVPTLLINLTTSIGSSADTIIVGNFVGEAAMAAVTLTFPVFMGINTLAALMAVGGTVAMSIARGSGDQDAANALFSHALFVGGGAGALVALLAHGGMEPLAHALGARGEAVALVVTYAGIILLATPLFILNTCLAFFVRNEGRPVLAMWAMFSTIIVNILLNLLFVGGLGLGLAGAAWATNISQVAGLAILLGHFVSVKNRLRLVFAFSGQRVVQILRSGMGTSLDFVYQAAAILILNNFIVGLAGSDGIVVYTIVLNTGLFALSLFEGLSQTMQPMVSVFHGEANPPAVRATMKLVCGTALAGSVLLAAVFSLFPGLLAAAFGLRGTEVFEASVTATRIYAPGIILMTFNVLMSYYYQSIERPYFAAVIVFCRSFACLLLATTIMGTLFGLNGVWFGFLISESVTMALWIFLVMRKRRAGQNLLLLAPVDHARVLDEKLVATPETIHDTLTRVRDFLGRNGVASERISRVMLAVDELASNLVHHDTEQRSRNLEVRIVVEKEILLFLRDDGQPFDPSLLRPCVQPQVMGGKGLLLVRNLSKYFEYRPIFGMNRTLLRF